MKAVLIIANNPSKILPYTLGNKVPLLWHESVIFSISFLHLHFSRHLPPILLLKTVHTKANSEIRFAMSGELSSDWLNWFDKPASDWPNCIDKPITHYDTWFSRFDDGRETAVETAESQNRLPQ